MKSSSKLNESRKDEPIYISAVDFEKYLQTLPIQQARELKQFLEQHPLVEAKNKGIQKIYKGSPAVLKEIQYLIEQSKQQSISESSIESFGSSIQPKLFVDRVGNLSIRQQNFNQLTNKIATLKRIERCPFEMVIRNKNSLSSEGDIYITNRCKGIKKVFFIFKDFHQLIQLQALLDMEWKLETIGIIRQKFEEEGLRLLKNTYSSYELFFFQYVGPESWDKFIANINKNSPASYLILMKFCLFPELYSNRKKFINKIMLAFPQTDLSLDDFTVTQLKVFAPDVQFSPVHELALAVLRNNEREYIIEGEQMNCVTSFNLFIMQDRGSTEMLVVRPDQANTKQYIYFTYYGKLMRIVREEDRVMLVQRQVKQEIVNSIYRNSLDDLIKQAAVNQCPFFYFCELAKEVSKISIKDCKKIKGQDINRLLYYQYMLNVKHYKASANNIIDINEIMDRYETPFLFKFQNEQIVSKMGKTKSELIIKKYREGAKGCIVAQASFCRTFIEKCADINKPK